MHGAQLYIDQGNTRAKFWVLSDRVVLRRGTTVDLDDLQKQLKHHFLDRIVLATVKTSEEADCLVQKWTGPELKITKIKVDERILPTAYEDASKLGIDRWLGVLAARSIGNGSALIVDAGTAITLDVLSENGMHAGGYILPGLEMQQNALAAQTARVRFPQAQWDSEALGRSTASAVGHGSVRAICALVREMSREIGSGHIYLTGGNARDLAPFLPEAQLNDDLLLAGMRAYVDLLSAQDGSGSES